MYSSDGFTAQVVGLSRTTTSADDDWAIGGGATIGIGECFQSRRAPWLAKAPAVYANNLGPISTDEEFWGASRRLDRQHLSEDTRLELGVGYEDYDLAGDSPRLRRRHLLGSGQPGHAGFRRHVCRI